MSYCNTEILRAVALLAAHREVLALEGKVGLAVIKTASGQTGRFPSGRRMALLAVAGEGAPVGIFVTRLTALEEGEVLVLYLAGSRRQAPVALGAGDLLMKPRQRVGGLVVRKPRGILPGILIMAAGAIWSEIPTMLINVAIATKCREAQVRFTQVGTLQAGPVLPCHLDRVVAFFAGEGRVFTLQSPPGLAVIETGLRRPPTHQLILAPVVFRVTPGAVRLRWHSDSFHDPRMVSALFGQAAPDLFMTIKALELRGARAHRVTGTAPQRCIQALVRLRQRAGRHLGESKSGGQRKKCSREKDRSTTHLKDRHPHSVFLIGFAGSPARQSYRRLHPQRNCP